jgi:hypothetical protein
VIGYFPITFGWPPITILLWEVMSIGLAGCGEVFGVCWCLRLYIGS